MTISTTAPRVTFNCDGVTTAFPVNIQAYQASDFLVLLTPPNSSGATTLVLNSNYTLATNSSDTPPKWQLTSQTAGGLTSPYPTGYTLQVILNPAQTQPAQFVQGQQFPSTAVQTAYDRLTQMVQRLQDEVSRAIHAPDGDNLSQMLLPAASARANLALTFDGSGLPIASIPTTQNLTLNQLSVYGADSGVANAYVFTHAGLIAAAATVGALIRFTALNANTGASTINVDGTGAVAVVGQTGLALVGGEIPTSGPTWLQYTGSAWQIVGTGATPDKVRTAAEIAAGVTPTNYAYPPGHMFRYGADPTGTNDSTPAWNSALAQRQHGGEKIFFPAGLYKGNFVVTGQYIHIETECFAYEDVATIGFIANNTANPIWQIGDGTTLTTSIVFRGGMKIHGQGTAQKGLLFFGVQNCVFDGLIVRGCTTYGVNFTASTTRPTSYVFIDKYRIDIPSGAASAIGLLATQPANYPTSYASALFLSNGAIQANSGTLWAVQINASCTIWVSNSYWSMLNNVGINFSDAAGSGAIICANLYIDTLGTTSDVLVTCAGPFAIQQNMQGSVTINGKISINGVTSTAALGTASFLPFRTMLSDPSITGYLDFQDGSAAVANQTVAAQQSQSISRSGSNLFIKNTAGAIIPQSSSLELTNGAGSADGKLLFGISGMTITTGTGAPSSNQPVGSLYLRTDGSSTSTRLYVSTGVSTWTNFTSAA